MTSQLHSSSYLRRLGLALAAMAVLAAASWAVSDATASAINRGAKASPRRSASPRQPVASASTVYNRCEANIVNADYNSIKLESAEKYSHDDWVPYHGPQDIRPKGQLYITMETESGFARGCWWRAKWSDRDGSITVYLSDPYSGANEYSCTTTGRYRCYRRGGQPGFLPDERLSGDLLRVNYEVTNR